MALYNESDTDKKIEQLYLSNVPDQNLNLQEQQVQQPTGKYTTHELWGAAFDRTNWAASLWNHGVGDWTKSDPNFNPWDQIKETEYQDYPEYFRYVDNEQDVLEAKQRVDEVKKQDEIFRQAGTGMTAFTTIASGALDPLFVLPYIGQVKIARTGYIVGKTIATTAAATGAAIGVGELALQASQPDRSATDSLLNIAAGSVVGGAIGGWAAKMAPSSIKSSVSTVKQILGTTEDSIPANYTKANEVLRQKEYVREVDPGLKINKNNYELPDINDPKVFESTDGHVSPFMKKYYEEHNVPLHGDELRPISIQGPNVELKDIPTQLYKPIDNLERSAGAAEAISNTRIDALPNWAVKGVEIPGLRNPVLEGLTDESEIIRNLTSRLFNIDARLEQNTAKGGFKPTPISMEARTMMDLRETLDLLKFNDDQYLRHLQIDPESWGTHTKTIYKRIFGGNGVPSRRAWNKEVMNALNNGDDHIIPGVKNSAQNIRKSLNKAWDRQVEVGIIEPGTPKISNYFMRTYNIKKILEDRSAFEDVLAKDFMSKVKSDLVFTRPGTTKKAEGKIEDIEEIIQTYLRPNEQNVDAVSVPKDWKLKEIRSKEPLAWEDAKQAAEEAVDSILGFGEKTLGLSDVVRLSLNKAGPKSSKARALDTPYDQLAPWLVDDLDSTLSMYMNNASNAINMKQTLKDMGVDSPNDLRKLITDEYSKKRILEKPKGTKGKKFGKKEANSINKLNDLIAISMGQYTKKSNTDPFFRSLKNYNYVRLLGRVVISSIADPAANIIRHGLGPTLWDGLAQTLKQLVNGTWKLKGQEMRDLMTAINNEMDNIIKYMYDPSLGEHLMGVGEKVSQSAANAMSKYSGMNYWNNLWQRVSHNMLESRMLRLMKQYDKLSNKKKSLLADYGIDKNMIPRILSMQEKYGANIRGTHFSNVRSWSDKEARDVFWNMIIKGVRQGPLMPGKGTTPRLVQKYEVAKAMFQFKSFFSAATSKLLIPMMQNRDLNAATAIITMIGLGQISYAISQYLYGKNIDWSLKNLIYQGMNRSGFLGLMSDPVFNLVLKPIATGSQRAQFKNSSYFGSDPVQYLFGPSSSIIEPFWNHYLDLTKGEKKMSKKTMYQYKALIPFQNLLALDGLFKLINPQSEQQQTPYYGRQ